MSSSAVERTSELQAVIASPDTRTDGRATMHIRVEDVTHCEELLELSRSFSYESYMRLYGGDRTETTNAEQIWEDARLMGQVDRLRTLMAFDMATDPPTPLATSTLKIGSLADQNIQPDFLRYLKTKNSVDVESLGIDPARTMEVSMLAFAPVVFESQDTEQKIAIFRQLHSHAMLLGQQHGCDQCWSILTRAFARFVKVHCKLPCNKNDAFELNEEEYADWFARFPKYWNTGKPGLYETGPMLSPLTHFAQESNLERSTS